MSKLWQSIISSVWWNHLTNTRGPRKCRSWKYRGSIFFSPFFDLDIQSAIINNLAVASKHPVPCFPTRLWLSLKLCNYPYSNYGKERFCVRTPWSDSVVLATSCRAETQPSPNDPFAKTTWFVTMIVLCCLWLCTPFKLHSLYSVLVGVHVWFTNLLVWIVCVYVNSISGVQ